MKNQKQVIRPFSKECYFLGTDKNGVNRWLELPSWDCDWYWGFGYVESFTNNNNPMSSRDISEHTHFDSLFFNNNKNGFDAWNDFFAQTPYTKNEVWQILELMKTFYNLKTAAEVFGRGGSYYTENRAKEAIQDNDISEKINKIMLPAVFAEIDKIMRAGQND